MYMYSSYFICIYILIIVNLNPRKHQNRLKAEMYMIALVWMCNQHLTTHY
jgi:hypothetical protein